MYVLSPGSNLLHDLFLLMDVSLLLLSPVVDHLPSDVEVSHHQKSHSTPPVVSHPLVTFQTPQVLWSNDWEIP